MSNNVHTGVNADTVKHVLFGAGVVYENVKLVDGEPVFEGATLLGATSGGIKLSIKPEYKDLEFDGLTRKTVGQTVQIGEKATIEINYAEVSETTIKQVLGAEFTKGTHYAHVGADRKLIKDNYVEGLCFKGITLTGDPVLLLFEHAICTSGFDIDAKNKDQSKFKGTFECVAPADGSDTLSWHLFLANEKE